MRMACRWIASVGGIIIVLATTTGVSTVEAFSALPPPPSNDGPLLSSTTPSSTTTRTTTTTTTTTPFHSFQFAANGVCINPRYFQDVTHCHNQRQEQQKQPPPQTTTITTNNNNHYPLFTMINVPGDGDCMFLAVALAATTRMGWSSSWGWGGVTSMTNEITIQQRRQGQAIARDFRTLVAQVLESPDGWLYITGGTTRTTTTNSTNSTTPTMWCKASDLLQQATNQEPGLNSTQDYIQALITPGAMGGLYGGGPELTVMANILRRPISIYELQLPQTPPATDNNNNNNNSSLPCPIICKGTFGDGLFDDPCWTVKWNKNSSHSSHGPSAVTQVSQWHLHILIVDTSPTEKHACVLVPTTNQAHIPATPIPPPIPNYR